MSALIDIVREAIDLRGAGAVLADAVGALILLPGFGCVGFLWIIIAGGSHG